MNHGRITFTPLALLFVLMSFECNVFADQASQLYNQYSTLLEVANQRGFETDSAVQYYYKARAKYWEENTSEAIPAIQRAIHFLEMKKPRVLKKSKTHSIHSKAQTFQTIQLSLSGNCETESIATIPFSEGSFTSGLNLQVESPSAEPTDAQIITLAQWPDHSIRWAQVIFPCSSAKTTTARTVQLKQGKPIGNPAKVSPWGKVLTQVGVASPPLLQVPQKNAQPAKLIHDLVVDHIHYRFRVLQEDQTANGPYLRETRLLGTYDIKGIKVAAEIRIAFHDLSETILVYHTLINEDQEKDLSIQQLQFTMSSPEYSLLDKKTDLPYSDPHHFKLPAGCAITHLIQIHKKGNNFQPLAVVPSGSYIEATGAIPLFGAGTQNEKYNQQAQRNFSKLQYLENQDPIKGMLNQGDFKMDYGDWGNNEYDLAYALYLQYLRTGNPIYKQRADLQALHYRDVDINHMPGDRKGMVHKHGSSHRSGEADAGHMWVQGLLMHSLLNRDPRSLMVAQSVGSFISRHLSKGHAAESERELGWPLIALTSLQWHAPDPTYEDAMERLVDNILVWQNPKTGTWPTPVAEEKEYIGEVPMFMGILLEGMSQYHVMTQNPKALQSIRMACDWLENSAWKKKQKYFIYKNSPRYRTEPVWPSLNLLIAPGLAYRAAMDSDPKKMVFARDVFQAGVENMGIVSGKELAQQMRSSPMFLGIETQFKSK